MCIVHSINYQQHDSGRQRDGVTKIALHPKTSNPRRQKQSQSIARFSFFLHHHRNSSTEHSVYLNHRRAAEQTNTPLHIPEALHSPLQQSLVAWEAKQLTYYQSGTHDNPNRAYIRQLIDPPFGPRLSLSCHCQVLLTRSCFPWGGMKLQ